MPKIIVSDESCGLQANGDNQQRVSITSTEAYAKVIEYFYNPYRND